MLSYSKKESGTQWRLFLERIIFCNLKKPSSITPRPQDLIQKLFLNKELRIIYFPYKLGDQALFLKMIVKPSSATLTASLQILTQDFKTTRESVFSGMRLIAAV